MPALNFKSPYVWGGAGLVVLLLVVASRGSAGSSNSAASSNSLVAADQTNVALATIAAQSGAAQIAGQVAQGQTDASATTALTGQLFSYMSNTGNNNTALAMQTNQIAGAITTNRDNIAGTVSLLPTLANIASKQNTDLASIQSQRDQALATTGANAAVTISTSQDFTSGVLATIQANLGMHVSDNNVAINATNAFQSGINTQINTNAMKDLAKIQGSSLLDSQIVGAGASLLGGSGGGGSVTGSGGGQSSGSSGGGILGFLGGMFGGSSSGGSSSGGTSTIASLAPLALAFV
jgi:hypothetical protein